MKRCLLEDAVLNQRFYWRQVHTAASQGFFHIKVLINFFCQILENSEFYLIIQFMKQDGHLHPVRGQEGAED